MDAPRHAIIQKYSQERQYMLAHGVHDGRGRCQYSTRKEEKILCILVNPLRTHWRTNVPLKRVCVCVVFFIIFFGVDCSQPLIFT